MIQSGSLCARSLALSGLVRVDELRGIRVYLEASDALVPLELLAILVPLECGDGITIGPASELDGLTGRDSVKLLLHLLRLSPLWGHC